MNKARAWLAIALAAGVLGVAQAETLEMRDRSATFDEPGKPTRGMTRERVASLYGTPERRDAPVGDPPITRWDYRGFAVFFEYDKVIHAVSK